MRNKDDDDNDEKRTKDDDDEHQKSSPQVCARNPVIIYCAKLNSADLKLQENP